MHFGIFDHMDRSGRAVAAQYADRLRLIEACDRAGFYAYHLAEHHGTPLGLAPAPSVFLAAVAARTRRLRFGPMVYTLSIYHPLRAIEEICMLDQLSGGRLELGIGRGISPIEMGFYGAVDDSHAIYAEVLEILLSGLNGGVLNYRGAHFSFSDVPLEIASVQQPHPPLWYGVAQAERAQWAAGQQMNIVTNGPASAVRAITDAYKARWAQSARAATPLPKLGMSRHLVIAPSDAEAERLATPAYAQWFDSLLYLWRKHGRPIPLNFPDNFSAAAAAGLCIAGCARTVQERLAEEIAASGVNYLLCRLAFGNLPSEASLHAVDALRETIMPALLQRSVNALP